MKLQDIWKENFNKLTISCFQVSVLQNQGKEMLMVSSGAVAIGRQQLKNEVTMQQTLRDSIKHGVKVGVRHSFSYC